MVTPILIGSAANARLAKANNPAANASKPKRREDMGTSS
jgi:hypothetical protein